MNDANEVQRAAARLAGLRSHGRTPDAETDASARRTLATARIDREIRKQIGSSPALLPAQYEHLLSLLESWARTGQRQADAE